MPRCPIDVEAKAVVATTLALVWIVELIAATILRLLLSASQKRSIRSFMDSDFSELAQNAVLKV